MLRERLQGQHRWQSVRFAVRAVFEQSNLIRNAKSSDSLGLGGLLLNVL